MLDGILKKNAFWRISILTLLFLSAVIWYADVEVEGAIFFGTLFALSLILFSDLTPSLIPMLFLSVFVTDCYDSADEFLSYAFLAFPLLLAIVFHLFYYKRRIEAGESFKGLLAVSVAVTLAGVGSASLADKFSPTAIFYTLGLGFGMLLFYLFFSPSIKRESAERFALLMYLMGILSALVIVLFYIKGLREILETSLLPFLQASNNLSTFIMLALPFPFYFARKNLAHILSAFFMYLASLSTLSRGALVFATVELFALLIIYAFAFEKRRGARIFYILLIVLLITIFAILAPAIMGEIMGVYEGGWEDKFVPTNIFEKVFAFFARSDEARIRLFVRGVNDFKENILFGKGLVYSGNSDIYSPVKGAMNWYHMWTVQVFGSMGMVGVVAYLYNLFVRARIYKKRKTPLNMTFLLSYGGLFLMSQVNPGEFCPVPYAMIAVILFIFMEKDT